MRKHTIILLLGFVVLMFGCKEKNKAPEAPQLTSPANNATDVDYLDKVTLSWSCSDPDNDILSYDLYFGTTQDPPIKEAGLSVTTFDLTDLDENTTYYWKIIAKDQEHQTESQVFSFTTKKFDINDVKCVDYDGNEYQVVKIGNQIWMAENLRSLHYSDGTAIPNVRVYDDIEQYADTYGRLYTWEAVMNGETSSNENPSGVHGIAPEGWHVPSKAEWEELIAYLGGNSVAGGKMKAIGTTYWADPNIGATNESGFNALPGGVWDFANSYVMLYSDALFRTCTESSSENAYFVTLAYDNSQAIFPEPGLAKISALSVRCIKD
jgi:uncharacterized protein (TIGR02145 family)